MAKKKDKDTNGDCAACPVEGCEDRVAPHDPEKAPDTPEGMLGHLKDLIRGALDEMAKRITPSSEEQDAAIAAFQYHAEALLKIPLRDLAYVIALQNYEEPGDGDDMMSYVRAAHWNTDYILNLRSELARLLVVSKGELKFQATADPRLVFFKASAKGEKLLKLYGAPKGAGERDVDVSDVTNIPSMASLAEKVRDKLAKKKDKTKTEKAEAKTEKAEAK